MISKSTKSTIDMFGAWCGIGYIVAVFLGWAIIPGFLFPPVSPSTSAGDIWASYQTNYGNIRVGMVVLMIGALVFIPFAAVLTRYMVRVEEGVGTLTITFILGAAGNMMLTFYPAMWWLGAAFRPERAAEIIYMMNDMAWLQFLGGVTIYLAMPFAITVAALSDRDQNPPFPRWAGYANAWLGVIIVPDQLLFFFHSGPFAWNGLFGLWIPAVVFSGFFIVNFFVIKSAVQRDRAA